MRINACVCICIYIYLYVCVWRERSYVQLFQAKFIVYPSAYKVVLGFCSSHAEMIIQVLASNKRFEECQETVPKPGTIFLKLLSRMVALGEKLKVQKDKNF